MACIRLQTVPHLTAWNCAPLARVVGPSSPRTTAASARLSARTYATDAAAEAPCSRYLDVTHPDDAGLAPGSSIAKKLESFNETTLATYSRPPLIFTHGSGLDIYAECDPLSPANKGLSQRRYLDFSSGIAVNSLGHADQQIAGIAGEQAARLIHSSNLFHNEWSGQLAERLVAMTRKHGGIGIEKGSTGTDVQLKVFLSNSGTESNEAALKFARKYASVHKSPSADGTPKAGLVSFTNAFHGRTMGALSMTPNKKYQAPFAPLLGQIRTGTYNSVENLDSLIDDSTAGVIVEPIQGEGGIYPASLDFLRALRKRCNEVGALLIFDEIQCGLFRAGTMWCHSEFPVDIHPDIVTMAKPLANGYPIGAVLMRQSVADAIVVGDHGTTFGGGALGSRIAHHVLGRMDLEVLQSSMRAASSHLFERLTRVRELFPDLIKHDPAAETSSSPRGKGLIVGVSMHKAEHAGQMVKLARERGLIVLSAGTDTIRILPSLTVTLEQVDEAVDILESCFITLQASAGSK
ncbi:acetylornithine aminotransferase [Tilletia horrida]|uniref:Acetylornithine aminotransferase n=1 Tax=Tilletia horrida TaxID=155126 RepID=A0AAN6GIT9_9BASI|nr:acetylornithine aminotransferase [Tilletia horrida]KAK0543319.1 acetylornithine aminotransferase [Tilletia horrida]KAK0559814.1 acetylornithine aminotransferase [Tilletia horrida]